MMNPFAREQPSRTSASLISVEEFSEAYSAVEFACHFGLPPSGHVTLNWGLLGVSSTKDVQTDFNAFRKCVRDWLTQRQIPVVYLFSHETSVRSGLHSHFAVHIPLDFRRPFRRYVRAWATSRYGRPPGRGVKTTGMGADDITVWRVFSYLMKGYDRSAVLVSAANHPSGEALHLGDVIANVWQDPGVIELRDRVGVSPSVSRSQRLLGYLKGAETQVNLRPAILSPRDLDEAPVSAHNWTTWTGGGGGVDYRRRPTPAPPMPFRSKFEDGRYDVRDLYPAAFYGWVTRRDPQYREPTAREQRLQRRVNELETENFNLRGDLDELRGG